MKKTVTIILVIFLVAVVGIGYGEEIAAEVLPLPDAVNGEFAQLTVEEDPMIGPHEEGYSFREGEKVAASYADPSITVNIGSGWYEKTRYIYARVRIVDPTQLRTMLASPISSENTSVAPSLAKRVNAVVAINGDFAAKQVKGTVIRQGETLRLNSNGQTDVLLIDQNGDTHILENANNEDIEAFLDDAVNVFTFGPGLIINGEPKYGYVDRKMATAKPAQRMAFCQTGPLEYMLITSEGPEDPGSVGLSIDAFVSLLDTFDDIINAYNLDGGSCSTLVFRKADGNWSKINCPLNGKIRPVKDIIYFADAWMPDMPSAESEKGSVQEGTPTDDSGENQEETPADEAAE